MTRVFDRLMRAALPMAVALFSTTATAQAPVKVGVLMPTKSLVGKQGMQGAQLAAELINADGGILGGRKVELVIYDTNFQPNEGVAAAQRLIAQDGVKVIAGEISSTVALAVLQVTRSTGTLFVAAVPKHPDVTKSGYDRVFRLNSTTAMDAEFDAVLKNEVKPERVVVIAENSDFGRLTVDNMRKLFGPQLAMGETYEMNQSDFSTLVTKARGTGADLMCVAGSNMEQYGSILRTAEEMRFGAKRCLMPGILNSRGVQIAGRAAEGVFSADIYVPSLDTPLNRRFVSAYEARFKETPEKIEALGFESVWLAAQAMDKAGTADDMGKVAQTLRADAWTTPRGVVRFDGAGQASSGNLIRLVVKDGKIVPQK
jgi:branched-chain amino acid transport system substrate-binding protein